MTQWEYLTLFVEAEVHKEDADNLKKRFDKKKLPKYTPESMIPELDQLGAAGWELVHMEPVPKVGGKGDVLFDGGAHWSNQYFCVFKRPKQSPVTAAPPQVQPVQATTPPPTPTPTPTPAPTPSGEQG